MSFSEERKPSFLGAVNGMITGLVAITPAAGYVNGVGAILIGVIAAPIVWLSMNKLGRTRLFQKVDDTLGVVHTHGVAGLTGGLLVGLFADPHVYIYGTGSAPSLTSAGLFYGHPKQLAIQAGAALTVIVWDGLVTFILLKVIGLFVKLRFDEPTLEIGDISAHAEELYPLDGAAPAGLDAGHTAEPIGGSYPGVDNAPLTT
jgi:Amt family ammonium transporter